MPKLEILVKIGEKKNLTSTGPSSFSQKYIKSDDGTDFAISLKIIMLLRKKSELKHKALNLDSISNNFFSLSLGFKTKKLLS